MYDKEHILIGREIMMKKQTGWNGYSLIWFLAVDVVLERLSSSREIHKVQLARQPILKISVPVFATREIRISPPLVWLLWSIILENRAYLRAYMQQALNNMVYYRGDIKLSVQIGTPVLFQ